MTYKTAIETSNMTYQLVPPNDHRRNMAEKAIQTFKNHFVSVLSGCAPTMPMHLWCQLLPQVELQLLLLRQSRVNPNMSAYAHLYGQHDYNKHPFVPIGMEALVHDKPQLRRTYAEHCSKAFVLGTSIEHYRCWKFWSIDTRSTRVSGAAFFKHKYITNPAVSPEDLVIAAAANLSRALATNMPQQLQQSSLQALADLQDIFSRAANKYNDDPTMHHIPGANIPTAPRRPHLENQLESPPGTTATPPRVHSSARFPRVPNDIIHSRISSPRMHNAPSPPVVPTQLQFDHRDFPQPNPPEQLSPTKPRRSQRIADIGIGRNPKSQLSPPAPTTPSDAPAHNTRSRTQVRTITQEAILACITTYSDITHQHITARNASHRKFPRNMLNAVLDMTTGELLEMRHLLVNPKYKELWGKSYTKELGRLAQGVPGVTGTDIIIFI